MAGLELACPPRCRRVVRDAGGVELEPVDRRLAPGGNQQKASFDRLLAARTVERDRHAAARVLDSRDLDAGADNDALALELIEHDRGAFGIVLGERRCRFQHGHFAAEPAERLRHLQADRPGADNDETVRPLDKIENGFVGEIWTLIQARNRRQRRRRPGRDHETARADFVIVADRDAFCDP